MKRLLHLAPAVVILALSPKFIGILGAIVLIGGLIFVHELGHFLAAKRMGMPVEVFSMGFGMRLLGFKWKETDVRLSALPLGGYVKLSGYNPEEPDAEDPHGFLKQPFRKRMLFYSGGVLANVMTTACLLFGMGIYEAGITAPLEVGRIYQGYPAVQAGLQTGDLIESIGELRFPGSDRDEALSYIKSHPNQPVTMGIRRGEQPLSITVTPRSDGGIGRIGMEFGYAATSAFQHRPFKMSDLGKGARVGVVGTWTMGMDVLRGFGRLFSGRAHMKELGGPIAIAKMGYDAARAGWAYYLFFAAFISINLAVLNALPIPFLDGGHMAILAFEKLRGRDLSIQIKEKILTAGFFFLMSLIVFVFALDIWRLKGH